MQYTGKNVRKRASELKVGGAELSHISNTREDMDYSIDPPQILLSDEVLYSLLFSCINTVYEGQVVLHVFLSIPPN